MIVSQTKKRASTNLLSLSLRHFSGKNTSSAPKYLAREE